MLNAVLNILTFILILVSLFLVMIVLMQKSKDGGMGATLGGGAAEQAFGAETGNVLSRSTIVAAITFFVLAFALYLGRVYQNRAVRHADQNALPSLGVTAPASTPGAATPAAGTAAAPAPTTAPATAAPTAPAPATTAPAAPATTTPATATPAATTPTPGPEAPKKQP